MAKKASSKTKELVFIIMGSKSDWPKMEFAAKTLDEFGVAYETKIISMLGRFNTAGLDVIKTENLYNFDGAKGYSA